MDEWLKILLGALVVLATHLLEGITGFGSTVLALPFLSLLTGLKNSIPMLCAVGWVMSLYLVIRSWRAFQWQEFRFILLWVGLGLAPGMLLYEYLPANHLCVILGCAMIVIGLDGCRKCYRRDETVRPAGRNWFMRMLLFCGGIIQGAFGSGGPFVIIYAARALPEKSLFRVTLSLLWFIMNSIRMCIWTVQGTVWNREIGLLILAALPFMVVSVLIGDHLHRRVNQFYFRFCVYMVLWIAGAVMLIRNLLLILR